MTQEAASTASAFNDQYIRVKYITRYAAEPESYDRLSAAQIKNFFEKHKDITKDYCDKIAAGFLNSSVSPTQVQGATSYTVVSDTVPKVVQFRTQKLDMGLIELARQSYRDFVPKCEAHDELGTTHMYVWDLICGTAFCRVRRRLFAPRMEQRLQHTVQDFASFFASAWINQQAIEPPSGLLDDYTQTLNMVSRRLPAAFLPKLEEIRQSLPLLFRREYPMAIQHDDLLENNIHVDEDTGRITGIVDWQDAIIAPFGVSLGYIEIVLGVRSERTWHLHHDHGSLRKQFWDTLYVAIGEISEADHQSIEVARLFGLFKLYGFEENAALYLDALSPL